MKTIVIYVLLAVMGIPVFAQTLKDRKTEQMMDSIRFVHLRIAALKYPAIRQASISTDLVSGANVHAKLLGDELFEGKAQTTRVKAHFTVPIVSGGKNTVSATFGITNERTNLTGVHNPGLKLGIDNMKTNLTTPSFMLSFTRSDSLFNRPLTVGVVVTAMTNASFDQFRASPTGFASLNLIRNPVTSLSVGVVLIGDRSSVVPAYMMVSYARRFSNLGLELFADLPSRILLRKELSAKSFLSVGSELGGNLFFFNLREPSLPASAVSTSLLIKSGITYEHLIAKNVVIGFSAGVLATPMIKALDANGRASDHFIKTKSSNEPYVNVSLSFLPFWRGLRL